MYDPVDGERLLVYGQDADPEQRRILLRDVRSTIQLSGALMDFLSELEISRLRDFFLADPERGLNWPLVLLLAGVALFAGAALAYLTPVGGLAVLVAGVGALLMLRDLRWALLALLGVICLLPFASLPFKIGFTPTFLDLVFAALYVVWAARLVTRRQEDFILTPVGWPVPDLYARWRSFRLCSGFRTRARRRMICEPLPRS